MFPNLASRRLLDGRPPGHFVDGGPQCRIGCHRGRNPCNTVAINLDCRRLHAGDGVPSATGRRFWGSLREADGPSGWTCDLRVRIFSPNRFGLADGPHHSARCHRSRGGSDTACHPLAVDCGVSRRRAQQGNWHLGRRVRVQCTCRFYGDRNLSPSLGRGGRSFGPSSEQRLCCSFSPSRSRHLKTLRQRPSTGGRSVNRFGGCCFRLRRH